MREVITMGRMYDNPSHSSALALGQMFDPFGLVEKVRDYVSGGTTADPIPSPDVKGNPPATAASTSYEVTADGLWIRESPDANGRQLGMTMKGEIVTFLGQTSGEWYLIRNARNTQGWSSSKFLRAAGSQMPSAFGTDETATRYIELDGAPPVNVVARDTGEHGGMGGTTIAALVLGVLAVGGLYYYYTQD